MLVDSEYRAAYKEGFKMSGATIDEMAALHRKKKSTVQKYIHDGEKGNPQFLDLYESLLTYYFLTINAIVFSQKV